MPADSALGSIIIFIMAFNMSLYIVEFYDIYKLHMGQC